MQLYVPMSMATLRLLWLVQIGKGVFSLQWPLHLARDERVSLVLAVGEERVTLGARVRSCTPGGGSLPGRAQPRPADGRDAHGDRDEVAAGRRLRATGGCSRR